MLNDAQVGLLAELHKRGGLSAEAVVEAARHTSSPLHNLFEWDDKAAAHEHRLDQAREVIRTVRYEFEVREVVMTAPRYVHDPSVGNEQGYADIADVKADPTRAWAATRREINSALGTLKRARSVSLALSDDGTIARALERAILELEGLRSAGDLRLEGESAA